MRSFNRTALASAMLSLLAWVVPPAIAHPVPGDSYQIQFVEPVGPNPLGLSEYSWSGRFKLGEETAMLGVFQIASFSVLIGNCFAPYNGFDRPPAPGLCVYDEPRILPDTTVFDARVDRINTLTGVAIDGFGIGGVSTFLTSIWGNGLMAIDSAGNWSTHNPHDLNVVGRLYSGHADDNTRIGTYTISVAVPEPGTFVLVTVSLGALGVTVRRRKRAPFG